ncbi:hypothetical protein OA2633_00285 [Oceanicaulis sp. HTCC2633]|uniref:hypothetical protein n=1 Tax=Oceanicaulis sp. HTCC2633 TaxID=314254 RepID=UPI00006699EA|nr:hypothetical protein [Oceanicaulis sp. HTCC2633]EAP89184.1 hypothetical protein OA2633_00285 [Oceanicaulis sp. HTCC2633]
MPHRFIHAAESAWRFIVALYEPVIFYVAVMAAGALATAQSVGAIAQELNLWWVLELAAYACGSFGDLHSRGRAYAKLPPDQRASRLREWKSRLGLAAIGLAGGVFFSLPVHVFLEQWGELGHAFGPVANFLLVLIAVPVIDGFRGVFRILSGASSQEAFAGLVIGWAQRRAGAAQRSRAPASAPPPAPRTPPSDSNGEG